MLLGVFHLYNVHVSTIFLVGNFVSVYHPVFQFSFSFCLVYSSEVNQDEGSIHELTQTVGLCMDLVSMDVILVVSHL